MQKTIEGCGLDPLVPSARLADDMVETLEGGLVRHADAVYDCQGHAHSATVDCHDADVEIVTDLLNGVEKYVCEYTSEGDYPDAYFGCVKESGHDWSDLVKGWVNSNGIEWLDIMETAYVANELDDDFDLEDFNSNFKGGSATDVVAFSSDDFIKEFYTEPDGDKVIEWIVGELDASFDCEPEYDRGDWGCYQGDGCCLASYPIGEYEEQIDLACYPELQSLHDKGLLDEVLDDVNCDLYISRNRPRVKNEETGHYEYKGKETYDNGHGHPCLLGYCEPAGQWHFVVESDRMFELLAEAYRALTTFDAEYVERFIKSECED